MGTFFYILAKKFNPKYSGRKIFGNNRERELYRWGVA